MFQTSDSEGPLYVPGLPGVVPVHRVLRCCQGGHGELAQVNFLYPLFLFFKDGPFPVSFSFIFVFSEYSTKYKLKNLEASENRTRIDRA